MNWATTDRWADMVWLAEKVGALGPHGRAALLRKIVKIGVGPTLGVIETFPLAWPAQKTGQRVADRIRPWTKLTSHAWGDLGVIGTFPLAWPAQKTGQRVADRIRPWTKLTSHAWGDPNLVRLTLGKFVVDFSAKDRQNADLVRASIRLEDYPALMAELL